MDVNLKVDLEKMYFRYPLKVLRVLGLWRRSSNVYLYTFYSLSFLLSTQYLYAIFQIIYMIKVWGDIDKIAEASFLLLTQANMCLKVVFYTWNKHKIVKLMKILKCKIFAPTKPIHINILNSYAKIQLIEYSIFLIMAVLTISSFAIFPLFDVAPGDKVLPFKAWYPVPQNESPYYEILYFYQISCIWLSACINISIDRFSTSMTALGCAELVILHDNLANIAQYAAEDIASSFKPLKLYKASLSSIPERQLNFEDVIEEQLIQCILHHQQIVRFLTDAEDCFHWGTFAQFAASVCIICITGLQLTLVNPNSFKFVSKILYMIAMLAQILFICRIGDALSVVSGNLVNATYNSPWVDRRKSYKKTLIIFMERLKKPLVTRAGYFFPLSLQTYMSILRSSYSYFAVLRTMNSKN